MTPRLDPALPLVWRTPDTVQLGAAAPRAIIERPGPLETGLLQALRHGASLSTLVTIGSGFDGTPDQVRAFVDRLAPACLEAETGADAATDAASAPNSIAVDGEGPLAELVAAELRSLGHEVGRLDRGRDDQPVPRSEPAEPALVVIIADWAITPARHLPLMRRDVPHLVVLCDDAGIRVGPLVEPGVGPCVRCLDLARRDEDAAWPVIAAQLAGRPAPESSPRLRFEAAAVAARAVDDRVRTGESGLAAASVSFDRSRLDAHRRRHGSHPQCGCRAPGGIAIPHVLPGAGRPPVPSSARAAGVPA
jgi:bacteriocin biosynthesis cyclodehydratase domain-containing protein